jgi:hypothetical protein
MPTATTRKRNPSSLNDREREPKTVKDLSIEPTVPDLEYVDFPKPVPVIWRGANNRRTEGRATAANKKEMVRIDHANGQSDTPVSRLIKWGDLEIGASARIEAIDPSDKCNGQRCKIYKFNLRAYGPYQGQVAVLVQVGSKTFSYLPSELKLEVESSAIEKSDSALANTPDIATEVEAINSELNETEATFVNAGRATLSLYKLLGEKLTVARQDPEIGGYGKWGNWLKARNVEENRAKRAIRIADPENWSKLEAIAASNGSAVTDFTLTDALNALAEKRLPSAPEESPLDREQVAELFQPWGEFKANSGSNAKFYPFVLERPGGAKCFRSLSQAVDWHNEHCNDGNRLDAPKPQSSAPVYGAVPFAPNPERVAQLNQQLAEKVEFTPAETAAKVMPDLSHAAIVITSQEEIQEEVEVSIILPRVENDFYPTAQALTEQLLEVVDIEGQILEPCAGDGAIADLFTGFIANEPFPHATFQPCYSLDATERSTWEQFEADGGFDWAVTNPPFNLASKILPLSFEYARTGVAFLLRLSYLEPCDDRADWLKENADHLRHVIPVSPRPRFRSDSNGSDSVTTAWFVWRKDFSWEKLGIPCPFTFVRGWR